MSFRVHAVATIAALLMTSTAYAVTITNRDGKDVKVTVVDGDGKQDNTLASGKVIEGVCQKGCIIRLNDSEKDEYELDGSENVSVEEGFLYFDGQDATGAPQGGSAGTAGGQKAK